MREDDPLTKLREVSRTIHEQVDRAYSGFSLSDAASYTAFLQAHGRVLPQVEAWLKTVVNLPSWRERTEYLRSDLAELGHDLPECLDWQPLPGLVLHSGFCMFWKDRGLAVKCWLPRLVKVCRTPIFRQGTKKAGGQLSSKL